VTSTQCRLLDAIYERAMRRLRVSAGVLIATELALIARVAIDGLGLSNTLAVALTALLLMASLCLLRMGRRLNRDANLSLTDNPQGFPESLGSRRRFVQRECSKIQVGRCCGQA
jgi:hypothetical protein